MRRHNLKLRLSLSTLQFCFFLEEEETTGEYFQNAVPVYTSPKQVQSTSIGLPAGMNQLQLCPLFPSPRHCFKRPAEKYKRKEGTVNQRNQFSTTTQLDCATCLSVNSQQPIALCVCCRPRQHVQIWWKYIHNKGRKKGNPSNGTTGTHNIRRCHATRNHQCAPQYFVNNYG